MSKKKQFQILGLLCFIQEDTSKIIEELIKEKLLEISNEFLENKFLISQKIFTLTLKI